MEPHLAAHPLLGQWIVLWIDQGGFVRVEIPGHAQSRNLCRMSQGNQAGGYWYELSSVDTSNTLAPASVDLAVIASKRPAIPLKSLSMPAYRRIRHRQEACPREDSSPQHDIIDGHELDSVVRRRGGLECPRQEARRQRTTILGGCRLMPSQLCRCLGGLPLPLAPCTYSTAVQYYGIFKCMTRQERRLLSHAIQG